MVKVLGPQMENASLWSANSPLETVNQLADAKNLHVFLDASPNEEDYEGFKTMTTELKAHNVDVEAISRHKAHAWRVVTKNCRDSLLFINKNWA